jgi:hypothetical protein
MYLKHFSVLYVVNRKTIPNILLPKMLLVSGTLVFVVCVLLNSSFLQTAVTCCLIINSWLGSQLNIFIAVNIFCGGVLTACKT